MDRSTIVFLISSLQGVNTGIGGHYRSVKEIAALLRSSMDVYVITWGDVPSPVLEGDPGYQHLEARTPLSIRGIFRLRSLLKDISGHHGGARVHLVSVGWIFSCVSAWLGSLGLPFPRIHLRPGGEAARWPSLLNDLPIAVFHQKDLDLFRRLSPSRHIALVPGRVTPPIFDEDYLSRADRPFLREGFERPEVVAVSVMRVASDKRTPITLMYKALGRLNANGLKLGFVHLGTVQDELLQEHIHAFDLKFPAHMISDKLSTSAGPKYLHGHDAFVGIGRGVIEAMSLGIPAFIPVRHGDDAILCAITKDNWREFMRENFTHRARYEDIVAAGELIDFQSFLQDGSLRDRLSTEALEIYQSHLSPAASLEAWRDLLSAPESPHSVLFDFKRAVYFLFLEIKRWLRVLMQSSVGNSVKGQP